MLEIELNGLENQIVTLSDGSEGEFVWNDGINSSCYFSSPNYVGFEVPRFKIKDGATIPSADGRLTYKIVLQD